MDHLERAGRGVRRRAAGRLRQPSLQQQHEQRHADAQLGVGVVRDGQAGEILDARQPVADRVLVHVQARGAAADRRHVVEERAQRREQVGLGRVVDQRAERLLGRRGDQLGVRRGQEQRAGAEVGRREHGRPARGRVAADALHHLARLAVAAAVAVALAAHRPHAGDEPLPAWQLRAHLGQGRLQLRREGGLVVLRRLLRQHRHAAGDRRRVDDQAGSDLAQCRGDRPEVERGRARPRPRTDQHHRARRPEPEADALGAAAQDRLLAAAAEHLGGQRRARVPVGLHRLALGADLQRDQRRRPPQGEHVAADEARLVLHDHQAPPRLRSDDDRGDDVAVHDPGQRQRPDDERPAAVVGGQGVADLGPLDGGRLEQARGDAVVGARRRRGRQPGVVGVEDRARLDQQLGQLVEQLLQRRAAEHEIAEPLVDDAGAPQRVDVTLAGVDLGAQLGARLGVHDRDRGQIAERRGDLGVLGREHVRAAHVVEEDHADDLVAEDHRDGHDRVDLPEADGGLDDPRVLEGVVDDHRALRAQQLQDQPVRRAADAGALDVGVAGRLARVADAADVEPGLLVAQVDRAALDAHEVADVAGDDVQQRVEVGGAVRCRGDAGERGQRAAQAGAAGMAGGLGRRLAVGRPDPWAHDGGHRMPLLMDPPPDPAGAVAGAASRASTLTV
ncbi:MAG: hypothetical protein R2736_11555 [Solirubrobacterales bacterium]